MTMFERKRQAEAIVTSSQEKRPKRVDAQTEIQGLLSSLQEVTEDAIDLDSLKEAVFHSINRIHEVIQGAPAKDTVTQRAEDDKRKVEPFLKPPTMLTTLSTFGTAELVFNSVWPYVDTLHARQPDHPMFGPCEKGLVRAPFLLPGVAAPPLHAI